MRRGEQRVRTRWAVPLGDHPGIDNHLWGRFTGWRTALRGFTDAFGESKLRAWVKEGLNLSCLGSGRQIGEGRADMSEEEEGGSR